MENPKSTSDVQTTPQAKKVRLVPKRAIDKLEKSLNRLISKEKKLLSKIADANNDISEIYKSGESVTVSGIRVLENETLLTEIELDKVRVKISGKDKSLIEKLDHNDAILRSRRNQK